MRLLSCSIALALALGACAEKSTKDVSATQGPQPQLDEPRKTALPTVNVAKGEGWPSGAAPVPAAGLAVNEFAADLTHPRWLLVLPNGDVLAAESDSPGTDKSGGNVRGFIQKMLMKKTTFLKQLESLIKIARLKKRKE